MTRKGLRTLTYAFSLFCASLISPKTLSNSNQNARHESPMASGHVVRMQPENVSAKILALEFFKSDKFRDLKAFVIQFSFLIVPRSHRLGKEERETLHRKWWN